MSVGKAEPVGEQVAGLHPLAVVHPDLGAAQHRERVLAHRRPGRPGAGVVLLDVLGLDDGRACADPGRVSSSSIRTQPSTGATCARALGLRASNSSTTRGRPCVMSAPATPPVWKVRMVSCVPGSPIDCAAMMPTASPGSVSLPEAGLRP